MASRQYDGFPKSIGKIGQINIKKSRDFNLYKNPNINVIFLKWMGVPQQTDDAINIKKIYQANLHQNDLQEDPRIDGKKR